MKYDAREIRALYDRNESVMSWMRAREGVEINSSTAILYAYDAQAGSYLALLENQTHAELKRAIARRLAPLIDECAPGSILEAGVGEATTLGPLLQQCKKPPSRVFGFDLSLSRLLYARRYLSGVAAGAQLFTAALDRIPFADASIDVVFTFHAVEPNRGREREILSELLRVTGRRLVMVEPSYEYASDRGRQRMESLGYVRELPATLSALGHPPGLIERFGLDINPLNEAALIVVDKTRSHPAEPQFVSPISKRPLQQRADCWYCQDDGHAFPVIAGIPCLTLESGVLASKLDQF